MRLDKNNSHEKNMMLIGAQASSLLVNILLIICLACVLVACGQSQATGTNSSSETSNDIPSLTPSINVSTKTAEKTLITTPTVSQTSLQNLKVGSTMISKKDGMELVYVPEGSFMMGSSEAKIEQLLRDNPSWDRAWFADEQPVHEVYLDAFWIDKYEVSNEQFAFFVEDTGYQTGPEKAGYSYVYLDGDWEKVDGADWQHPAGPDSSNAAIPDYPVVHVGWNDAKAYCDWAGRRLSSEAEWEKAARGTEEFSYPWGNEKPNSELLNYAQNNGGTIAVGSYPAGSSTYGALDMAGNVWEIVADWYDPAFYGKSQMENPTGPSTGTYRLLRGGSWFDQGGKCVHSANRSQWGLDGADAGVGFRCAVGAIQ